MADDELQTGSAPEETTGEAAAERPARSAAKKTAVKKTAAAKTAAKKTAATTTAAKKTASKTAAKKTTATKAATKKTAKKAAPAEEPAAAESTPPPADQVAEPPADQVAEQAAGQAEEAPAPAKRARKAPAKKTAGRAAKKAATPAQAEAETDQPALPGTEPEPAEAVERPAVAPLFQAPAAKAPARRRTRKTAEPTVVDQPGQADQPAATEQSAETEQPVPAADVEAPPARPTRSRRGGGRRTVKAEDAAPSDEPVEAVEAGEETPAEEAEESAAPVAGAPDQEQDAETTEADDQAEDQADDQGDDQGGGSGRRRRRRGGRRRRKSGSSGEGEESESGSEAGDRGDGEQAAAGADETPAPAEGETVDNGGENGEGGEGGESSSRRRRRRRRTGEAGDADGDQPAGTVTRVRKPRSAEDEITSLSGSTRLEAKKQRRREGREAGRRRAPIVSEAEFLARRESVDRVMVVRQRDDLTQIAVLEDKVLVEHYVARESQTSLIGNVYLGRVQNVLPSMEAAFIDIGKGRNAVLYAGEVNWSALGHKEGQPRKIESVLSSGQSVLVQVTKDPIGHKGARLTSQISLAGRFLVYVPDGTTSGISRKLPDTERSRLKSLLKEIVPDSAGVIVRTAAEGASEEELTRDVERLKARWEDIEKKAKGNAPQLLYGEPDLTLKVVRDLFTEDFGTLVIQGDDAWETVSQYVDHVAPDLADRLERFTPENGRDAFATYRIDEQIAKGLDRKVWLPSGGSLVIDRTEAMTVVDVNTGKFTGSGGNLEETVTKNNLEAAEEIVRQLRLRDIGGIIVVDFIDMVLESNRDLVLRRLVECLGRDRTRHQVAEVTSLGLVQMTRKRIGTGLLEAFSETCEHCGGRGLVLHDMPVEQRKGEDDARRGGGGRNRGRGRKGGDDADRGQSHDADKGTGPAAPKLPPSPKDVAAMAKPPVDEPPVDEPHELAPQRALAAVETTPEMAPEPAVAPLDGTTDEAGTVEPPRVVTRTRRRAASRPAEAPPAADTAAPASPVAVAPAPQDAPTLLESAPQSAPQSTPTVSEEASAPEPPKVVTRTRRRAASRPAAAPAPASTGEPVSQVATGPSTPPVPDEPESAVPAGPLETPEPPEPPRVVTRTRRRAASRPAGPPSVDPVDPVEPAPATDAPSGEGDADQGAVEHVPVKKKGTRKR